MQRENALASGSIFMLVGALGYVVYAVALFMQNFVDEGFELGVETINGVTRADLDALNPAIGHYIGHLHVANAEFMAATGIAVGALVWYGVRRGEWWAWIAALVSPVVGLAVVLPMHWFGDFDYDWIVHLGPLYLVTLVYAVGVLVALWGLVKKPTQG